MTDIPDLQTDRLELRPPTVEDSAFGGRLHCDPAVRRYLGGPTPEDRLPDVLRGYLTFGPRRAAWIVRTEETAGAIGLVTLSEHKDDRDVELSYQFLPAAWGRGYASEATRAVLEHAGRVMHLPSVIAETQAANAPSRRLLECLGMTQRATLHRFSREQVIYELPLVEFGAKRPTR
ncbi:MAG: GNAT family N-acetyltransferase [Jannaschia sp.]